MDALQNPPPKNNYGPPKTNDTLDDLLKSIRDLPNTIIRAFGCTRTNSENDKGPKQT